MQTILLALDLSAASEMATRYCAELQKQWLFHLTVLNVVEEQRASRVPNDDVTQMRDLELQNTYRKFVRSIANQMNYPPFLDDAAVDVVIEAGEVVETIVQTSEKVNADLIIIGTRKKHGLWDYLMGSVSTLLIKQSRLPVLIVPEVCSIQPIRQIALATDLYLQEEPSISFLHSFARKLRASIEKVYVFPLLKDYSDQKEEVFNASWFEDELDEAAQVTIVRDSSTVNGLDYFVREHAVDLLALYIPQRSLLKSIFHRSLSKQLVLKAEIPILVC